MKSRSGIFVVISFLGLAVIYSSFPSTAFQALAEPSGQIHCKRTGTVAATCCQDHIINRSPANPAGTLVTYCTDCNYYVDTAGDYHIKDCGERYIAMAAEEPITVPPSAVKQLQGILGEATTLPEVSVLEAQRANISILSGGILQAENNLTFSQKDISSNNDNNNTMALDQSDLGSDTVKKPTRTVDDGVEGQDESQTTEEPSDEPVDKDKTD